MSKTKPSNKTLQNKKRLIEAMEKSLGVVTSACKIVGVSRFTYYDYYNNDPDFKASIDAIQDIAIDFAESKLHQQIDEGNTTATIFFLKTKGKKRGYVERQEIAATVESGESAWDKEKETAQEYLDRTLSQRK